MPDQTSAPRRAPRPRRAEAYPSLARFYLGNWRRLPSREDDVGLWWREGEGRLHHGAWVRDTGELYLMCLGPTDTGGGRVEVLGVAHNRGALDRALAGWRRVCGQRSSLGWLRARASSLSVTLTLSAIAASAA